MVVLYQYLNLAAILTRMTWCSSRQRQKQESTSLPETSGVLDIRHFLRSRISTHTVCTYVMSNHKYVCFANCFSHYKKSKKQRSVEVDHGSFIPFIFNTTTGMGRLATMLCSILHYSCLNCAAYLCMYVRMHSYAACTYILLITYVV